MYDYVDRKVDSLNPGGRLLVWAMRAWVQAVGARKCPCSTLGPVFVQWRIDAALPYFSMAMAILNREAIENLRFRPPACRHVAENEAVLLDLFGSARDRAPAAMRATLAMLVAEQGVDPLHKAIDGAAALLGDAGLLPIPPYPAPKGVA